MHYNDIRPYQQHCHLTNDLINYKLYQNNLNYFNEIKKLMATAIRNEKEVGCNFKRYNRIMDQNNISYL